jgi:hypothetical protein
VRNSRLSDSFLDQDPSLVGPDYKCLENGLDNDADIPVFNENVS